MVLVLELARWLMLDSTSAAASPLPRFDAPDKSVTWVLDDVGCCRPGRVVGMLPIGRDVGLLGYQL
jgi:hypothetical protein